MADVFISYAHEDRESAARVAAALESRSWSVWWDRELVGGQNFRRKIAEALAEARCIVVLWSPASLESNWVLDEAQEGQRRNVLVPVQLTDSLRPPLGFRSFQTLSLAGWLAGECEPEAPCLEPLFRAVQRAIAGTASIDHPRPVSVESGVESRSEASDAGSPRRAGRTEPKPAEADRRTEAKARPPVPPPVQPPWSRILRALSAKARALRPRQLVTTKGGLGALLGIVFAVNYLETRLETTLGWSFAWQENVLDAFRWFERGVDFEFHDLAGDFAVGGFTLAYFGIFPLLALLVAAELYGKDGIAPFRVLSLSVGINYAVSLPFFVWLPIRERWADPASGAMLLSDRASSVFIELIRPFSGLDNCFPSFHTSLTVALIVLGFLYSTTWAWCALGLGLTVVLSTFALGIHWLPDILAGASLGVISVCLARRLDARIVRWELEPVTA